MHASSVGGNPAPDGCSHHAVTGEILWRVGARCETLCAMRIAVPLETAPGEQRVALTPDSAARLVKGGHELRIQAGAGTRAGFPDSAYEAVGATVSAAAGLYTGAELVCR